MKLYRIWGAVTICVLLAAAPPIFAQTPTPTPTALPGTPVAVTCFDPESQGIPFLGGMAVLDRWDSIAVKYEAADPADYPLELAMVELALIPPSGIPNNAIEYFTVYIYEMDPYQDSNPNVTQSGNLMWQWTYIVPVTQVVDLVWVTFDLNAEYAPPPPVINSGKFAVRFQQDSDSGLLDYQMAMDNQAFCAFYDNTNIRHDFSANSWNFLTSSDPGNWVSRARYFANGDYRVPASGPWGIAFMLIIISIPLLRIFRK
ncbi:hypothetical protein JW979_13965 [bacterium]|nr:hypothetical protein [candidate division CSSED10-310 bacterium]